MMTSYELHLPPVRPKRNPKNGRFLTGHIPANKGKKWDEYLSKHKQKRCAKGWANVEKYRPTVRIPQADAARKQ